MRSPDQGWVFDGNIGVKGQGLGVYIWGPEFSLYKYIIKGLKQSRSWIIWLYIDTYFLSLPILQSHSRFQQSPRRQFPPKWRRLRWYHQHQPPHQRTEGPHRYPDNLRSLHATQKIYLHNNLTFTFKKFCLPYKWTFGQKPLDENKSSSELLWIERKRLTNTMSVNWYVVPGLVILLDPTIICICDLKSRATIYIKRHWNFEIKKKKILLRFPKSVGPSRAKAKHFG